MLEEQLEPSEEREEGKAGGSGPCGPWENLGFYLRAGGEPGELWTEEGLGFAQVFTGALWWLLGTNLGRGHEGQLPGALKDVKTW